MTYNARLTDVNSIVAYMLLDTDYVYKKDWKWGKAACIDSIMWIEMVFEPTVTEEEICILKLRFGI